MDKELNDKDKSDNVEKKISLEDIPTFSLADSKKPDFGEYCIAKHYVLKVKSYFH